MNYEIRGKWEWDSESNQQKIKAAIAYPLLHIHSVQNIGMYKLCQFDWLRMFLLSYATRQSISYNSKQPKDTSLHSHINS